MKEEKHPIYIIHLIPGWNHHFDEIQLKEGSCIKGKHNNFIKKCCLLAPRLPFYKQLVLRKLLQNYLNKYHLIENQFELGYNSEYSSVYHLARKKNLQIEYLNYECIH